MRAHLFNARTLHSMNTGYSQIKVTKFNQHEGDLRLFIERLRKEGCLSYTYHHLSVQDDELTIERDLLPGVALDMLDVYTPYMELTLVALMVCYRRAADAFAEYGFGFITTDYKELSNVMYDPVTGGMQLIDFEDSFVTTANRELFDAYWNLALQHTELEFQRFKLLSTL